MKKYLRTQKIWSQWHQQRSSYIQLTNQAKHIITSKSMVETYGPRMVGCHVFCELGVGSGRNIYYFHEKYPDWIYIGNDINPNIHNEIKSIYPRLLDWASIEIIDTLSYLRKDDLQMDVTFTHGHLTHIPNDVIREICTLIAQKTKRYILLYEAYCNEKGIGFLKKLKYRRYRFDRDYEGMFPGFVLEDKRIFNHPTKRGIRYGRYFFKKDNFSA